MSIDLHRRLLEACYPRCWKLGYWKSSQVSEENRQARLMSCINHQTCVVICFLGIVFMYAKPIDDQLEQEYFGSFRWQIQMANRRWPDKAIRLAMKVFK